MSSAPTASTTTGPPTGLPAAGPASAADLSAADQLLALHRAGRLAAEYPRLAALLADLTDPELARTGLLLARLDPDQVLAAHPATPILSVALTGHGTLAALPPALAAEFARHGLLLRHRVSEFDSYVFDLADPDSELYAFEPDLTVCLLDPEVVFDEAPLPWRPADLAPVLTAKLDLIERLVATFTATSRATLVLNTLPLPAAYARQLVDHRSRAELGALWRRANARLLDLAAAHPGLVVVDLDPLLAEGLPARDPRLARYTKAHLSNQLLARYARELGHLARHLTGRTRKCLVLDLDDTLWGGTLGEDGPDGIEVADGYRGEAFAAFQRTVKQLAAQGVMTAVVSKNEPEPVRAAFRDHPRMTLREADLLRITANWRPKDQNLAELAADLNIGLDSLVFVDDSPYELGLVRHALPAVATVAVDGEPALHAEKLLRDGWFDVLELTGEDRARVARYREELDRRDFLHAFGSLDDYLRELSVRVEFAALTPEELPRAAQLTLRTNQFHLATERLQPAELAARAARPGALVLGVRASDRFGSNGLVGLVLARRDAGQLVIDNFLLSCRVFSRGIEGACLAALLAHARALGLGAVLGRYRPGAKNAIVRDFYPRYGFTLDPAADALPDAAPDAGRPGLLTFRHDLAELPAFPDHLQLSTDLVGVPR
ncbi:methoxymalonyl-ACP biosynthesis protein FkbH [Streptomyces tateyamensis]|uniref:Methoxymalonyl-ACP biosynthesis protein FkbH n=1 Tax=Streptomyces tateyamensis TaxID=565073 RepID=A0A2V4NUD3_9ACTN|nr:HAD-IIIC family phosphatase [Streptomyces tateyamensis]PYC68198.1 methoxymalonyl-ACP biosynthesis protein FkbH [Streptomyces tateyamensis]